MHISLLQENLLKALIKTSRIISSKPQLPILQSILLKAQEDKCTIIASSLDVTEKVGIGGKVTKEGGLCVPARLLTEFVSSLSQETVELEVVEGSLKVSCGKTNATIPGTPPGEFPSLVAQEELSSFPLKKNLLMQTLSSVLFAAATDDSRPLLTGVKITNIRGVVVFTTTDGYRLCKKEVVMKIKNSLDLIIPARALTEVVKLCGEEKELDQIVLSNTKDGQLMFAVGDTELYTRRIDGEYPSTEKIIPGSYTTRLHLDREQLARAVRSAAVFARDNANIIRFHTEDNLLVVSANTPSIGENKIEVDAKGEGEGGDIAFNSRFLTEFLSNVGGEEIVFEMTGSLNPGVFKIAGDDSFLHIIMPVRVQA